MSSGLALGAGRWAGSRGGVEGQLAEKYVTIPKPLEVRVRRVTVTWMRPAFDRRLLQRSGRGNAVPV